MPFPRSHSTSRPCSGNVSNADNKERSVQPASRTTGIDPVGQDSHHSSPTGCGVGDGMDGSFPSGQTIRLAASPALVSLESAAPRERASKDESAIIRSCCAENENGRQDDPCCFPSRCHIALFNWFVTILRPPRLGAFSSDAPPHWGAGVHLPLADESSF